MKKILAAALAVFFALSAPALSQTAPSGRTIVYPLENPPSTDTTLQPARFERLAMGSFLADGLQLSTAGTGEYANCTTAPGTGLYVTIAPTVTAGLCSLYYLTQDDANPIPTGYTPQLPADSTLVVVHAMQSATTAPIGPLTAPGSNSVYWLIEAQISTTDTDLQTRGFFNPVSGQITNQSVNTQRNDAIVYQTKEGTPAGSPTKPSVDTGWVAIAYALVPSGTTQITTGMLSAGNAWSGFGAGGGGIGSVTASSPLSSSGGSNPNLACSTCITTAGGQTIGTTTTTFSGLTPFNFSSTGGVDFTNNATGAQVGWILNLNNASPPTTDIIDFQLTGSNVLQVLNSGGLLSQGAYTSASTTPLSFTSTTTPVVGVATMGSSDGLVFNFTGSPFTGNYLDLKKAGTSQFSVSNGGIATSAGGVLVPFYTKTGTAAMSSSQCVNGSLTAAGASTTVTFTGGAVFSSFITSVAIEDNTAGTEVASSAKSGISTSGFTFTSTSTHGYGFMACGF